MKKILYLLAFLFVVQNAQAQKNTAKQVVAIYENCTVYAGSTEYAFKNAKTKEPIVFNVLNLPEKGIKTPKLPKNLIDPSKNLEGVPGANPALVGKAFMLLYDAKGELLSVKPIKK